MRYQIHRSIDVVLAVFVACGAATRADDTPTPAADNSVALHSDMSAPSAKGRTLLFVDDHHVLYRSGTRRFVRPADRRATTAMIRQEKPWELAIGWTSIYRNPKTGKYQLWYQGYGGVPVEDKRMECVVCYAESDDGLTFIKPELDLFPFEGGFAKTNIVLDGSGVYGDRYCNSVLVDEREPDPKRRYKMAYYDWVLKNGRPEAGLHVAFSPDGIHWTKHPEAPLYPTAFGAQRMQPPFTDEDGYVEVPVKGKPSKKHWNLPLTMSDASDVFYDPKREVFAIYGKAWIDSPIGGHAWKHAMMRSESKDFLHWSKAEFILAPDDLDPPHVEFHTSPVFYYHDCYFSLNQILNRGEGGGIDLELMTSRNGTSWDRSFRKTFFLPRSESGGFDSRAMFSNSTPVILDDEIRFYYGAYSQSPIGGVSAATRPQSGVGMASIPRDRFAGIRPVEKSDQPTMGKFPVENIGQITLKPLDLSGAAAMTLNADAARGKVRVEVLNEDGFRVPGFTADDAQPITGDELRHEVAWKEKRLVDLPPGKYMLRLHLDNAAVYAATFR
jgi:hypothetical protein